MVTAGCEVLIWNQIGICLSSLSRLVYGQDRWDLSKSWDGIASFMMVFLLCCFF